MNKRLKALKDVTAVQCSDGNWNHDPYMQGMANGLLLAVHIMTASPKDKTGPLYLSVPIKIPRPRKATKGKGK